jgi:hypothetical protein
LLQPADSSADLPKFEQRYDVSRREHEVKSRTGTQNARTCALPATVGRAVFRQIQIDEVRSPLWYRA